MCSRVERERTTLPLGRSGYDVCHSPLYFVNENVHLIMSPHFLTHKQLYCKVESSENSLYWGFRGQDHGDISH